MPLISRKSLTVSQITAYIKQVFAGDNLLENVKVQGEVSNIKYHTSGHIYFTIKDAGAALDCIMFRSSAAGLKIHPQNGDQVVVSGRISVYEARGSYQLYAISMESAGIGALYEQYEKLKAKLSAEGLFDQAHKKPIPKYAKTVGVVTAKTGAAIQDICNISARRNPYVQLVLCPATVQGPGASETIVRAIKCLDMLGLDVIIVGRGGGPIEDLWAFNEENVARAIYECNTPIISAVGHETDTTIADWVSDLRAPTPSAGAELAVFKLDDAYDRMNKILGNMDAAIQADIARNKSILKHYSDVLEKLNPKRTIENKYQQLDAISDKLQMLMKEKINRQRSVLQKQELKLKNILQAKAQFYRNIYMRYPDRLDALINRNLEMNRNHLEKAWYDMDKYMVRTKTRDRHRFESLVLKLDSLSPLKRMASGYGYISGDDNKPKTSVSEFKTDDDILIRMKDGRIKARVSEIQKFNGDN